MFRIKTIPKIRLNYLPLLTVPISNDSLFSSKPHLNKPQSSPINPHQLQPPSFDKQKFYKEITIGSMSGLFVGFIIGKFSLLIAYLSVSVYLFIQFLESRNLFHVPFTLSPNLENSKQFILKNFNFKLSFLSSFLITMYNV